MAVAVSGGFVGRGVELARLVAALERAEHGTPQVVLLAGDAGVGKTRLLSRFTDRAKQGGVCVLVGGCVELGDIGLAYLPIVDALGDLVEQAADAELLAEVAETTPSLGRLLPGIGVVRPAGAVEVGDGLEQLRLLRPCGVCSCAARSGRRSWWWWRISTGQTAPLGT